MPKILFVTNSASFFLSHRSEIAKTAVKGGLEVHLAAANDNESISKKLESIGLVIHDIAFSRKGKNPLSELNTVLSLFRLIKILSPDIVHLITIKPYLYGGIVARMTKVPSVVSAVAGLGILFSSSEFKYKILRVFLYPLYRLAFGHKNQKVIFQNIDDRDELLNWGVVSVDKPVIIPGSGVDLQLYPYLREPDGVPVITFAARLLIDKGVKVFAEASRILKQREVAARFWLIGEVDAGNANTVTESELKQWQAKDVVELYGFREDIPSLFAQSNIVTLPSFYGEGLPKVLVEAAACGRAVITTDYPGCRDAISPNETGLLVRIKDPVALADAIQYLIQNSDIRKKMGSAGRVLAEREFAIEKIVKAHMDIFQELLERAEHI